MMDGFISVVCVSQNFDYNSEITVSISRPNYVSIYY